jgi:hypothetical protein
MQSSGIIPNVQISDWFGTYVRPVYAPSIRLHMCMYVRKCMQSSEIIPNVQISDWFGTYVRPVCTIDSTSHVYVCKYVCNQAMQYKGIIPNVHVSDWFGTYVRILIS